MARSAITGALLIDGTDGPPVPGTTVVWEASTIIWVGPDGEADLTDTTLVDAGGGAVLPGLIDAHVHLCGDGSLDGVDRLPSESVATIAARSTQNAKRLLDAGITSARDQGSTAGVAVEVAKAQRAGWLIASRILAAGRGVTPTKGHGWQIGVEADGVDAVRAAVAEEIARGADVIKLFPTGGVLGDGAHGFDVVMSQQEVSAGVAEAHAHDRLVGAHIHGPEGIAIALAAGVDTIEHGTALTEQQAEQMVASGTALVPTLVALDAMKDAELPADLRERVDETLALAGDGIRGAISAGVRVLIGTDAGTPFNPAGAGLVTEMRLLADLGLGTAGAIRSATSLAADTLGLADRGVVAVGRKADLVLVAGDPLEDLDVLRSPRAVAQDGKIRVVV